MNTYPMICKDCNKQFELVMKISDYDNSPHDCIACGSSNTTRDWSTNGKVAVVDNSRWRKGEYGKDDKR